MYAQQLMATMVILKENGWLMGAGRSLLTMERRAETTITVRHLGNRATDLTKQPQTTFLRHTTTIPEYMIILPNDWFGE